MVLFESQDSAIDKLYDNHDVFDLENLYWETNTNKVQEQIKTPIIPPKRVFLRNVGNKGRRIFK